MFFEKLTSYSFEIPIEGGMVVYHTADPQEIDDYLKEGFKYEIHSTLVLAPWFQAWVFFAIMACLIYGIFAFWVLTWK